MTKLIYSFVVAGYLAILMAMLLLITGRGVGGAVAFILALILSIIDFIACQIAWIYMMGGFDK